MAKRELISKNSIISLYKYFSKGERVFAGQVIVDVKAIPPITEQEIVKPYLEKLMIEVGNLEINKPMASGYGFKQKSPQEIKDEVIKLIDNLLSEQEVK